MSFYSDAFRFTWDKWLFLIHAMITLSGATVLVFLNSLKILEIGVPEDAKRFAYFTVALAAGALVSAILWRFTAQHFMECVVLGSKDGVKAYIDSQKLPKNTSYGPYEAGSTNKVFLCGYYLGLWGSLTLLVASWFLAMRFFLSAL